MALSLRQTNWFNGTNGPGQNACSRRWQASATSLFSTTLLDSVRKLTRARRIGAKYRAFSRIRRNETEIPKWSAFRITMIITIISITVRPWKLSDKIESTVRSLGMNRHFSYCTIVLDRWRSRRVIRTVRRESKNNEPVRPGRRYPAIE